MAKVTRTLLTAPHSVIVADKYKKTETLTIKDKINRLNSHSIAKKTARLSQHIKHETGIATKVGKKLNGPRFNTTPFILET